MLPRIRSSSLSQTWRISEGLPAIAGKPWRSVPWPAWSVRGQLGDLLFRGVRPRRGARVRLVRGTPRLFDENPSA